MTTPNDHYMVAIGTSAGGLEALERFFKHMPYDDRLVFLVVQHLSPDYKSHMVELLSKHTPMPVHEAADGIMLETGQIYLLPPRKNMTVYNGKVYLMEYDRTQGLNLPIDILFESLAKDQGSRAIACILSGTGSDGTRGLRAIKEHGGIVLAQDNTAKFDGMPRSAIATQLVDYVAAPEDMPTILQRYIRHPKTAHPALFQSQIDTDRNLIEKVMAILRDHDGVDFSGYKPNTLLRRIDRRMALYEIESLQQYVQFLQTSESERTILFKEFLIGVTRFFRDPEAFDYINQTVIPAIMSKRPRQEQVRIWVPACSTGEEAYSLAILFQHHMETTGNFADVKVFATDIDRDALERAGQGVYPESIAADVPEHLLKQYFVRNADDQYEILRQIRHMVVFAHQNIITHPPFSRLDLISCRNLMIYLQPDVQAQLLSLFQFALKSNGYLFLGSSESLGDKAAEFAVEDAKWKIYRLRTRHNPLVNTQFNHPSRTQQRHREAVSSVSSKVLADWRTSDPVLRSLVEHMLPPCVVIDESWSMIHGFGQLDAFIQAPRGYQVSLNITKLVREGLSLPLSTALHQTFKTGDDVTYRSIEMTVDGETQYVTMSTRLFWHHDDNQRLCLVTFMFAQAELDNDEGEPYHISDSVSQRLYTLEQELQYTRESLQATIEELETSNEELQATNEELMAANEELQSTNEELESVNEELITVNNEFQAKIKELSALNDDMNNLLKSTDVGTVFLDANLNVRKFTPAAQEAINLMEQDIGRPLQHIAHKLGDFSLMERVEQVLESLMPQEVDVRNKDGRWLLVRIMPYRTHTNTISGVVLTFVDVTDMKHALQIAEESDEFTQVILNSLSAHIAVLDQNGVITHVNEAWQRFSWQNGGNANRTDVGINYLQICQMADQYEDSEGAETCYTGLRALLDGEINAFDLEYPCHAPDEERWYLMRAVPLNTRDGRIVVSHIDITETRKIQNHLRLSEKRFKLASHTADMVLFEQDINGRYTWIHNTGLPYPPQDASGYSDVQLLPIPQGQTLAQYKQAVLQAVSTSQHRITITADDTTYTCQMLIERLVDEKDQPQGIIGVYYAFQPA